MLLMMGRSKISLSSWTVHTELGSLDDQYNKESTTKIAVLQWECDELVNKNVVRKEEINKLKAKLDSLQSDGVANNKKIEEL